MLAAAGFLTTILLLCQSTGSMLYGFVLITCVVFLSWRSQSALAVALAVVVFAYPAIRTAQLLPVEELVQLAEERFGEERASSMAGRLRTEEQLTSFVQAKPLFGWGSPGRAMIIDEFTGENKTIFDGFWLIEFVTRGLVGFLCVFGLLLVPVFRAAGRVRAIRSRHDRMLITGLSLMVAVRAFDLLPNSTTEGYLTLLSGALSGSVFGILREQSRHRRTDQGERSDSDSGTGGPESGSGPPSGRAQKPTLGRDLLGVSGSIRRHRRRET
jgi:O-antigen ligase